MRFAVTDALGAGLLLVGLATAGSTLVPAGDASATARPAARVAGTSDVERGRTLFFVKGCVSCHWKEQRPVAEVGPDLRGLASRAAARRPGMSAEAYVRESIRTPSAFIVPGFEGAVRMPDLHLTDDEIDAVTVYLLSTP